MQKLIAPNIKMVRTMEAVNLKRMGINFRPAKSAIHFKKDLMDPHNSKFQSKYL